MADCFLEPFYKDFFAPPRSGASKREKGETRKDGVRFHDEVRVKKIKAKGKNLPLSLMFNADEDEDEEGEEDDEDGDDEGMIEALQGDEDEDEEFSDDGDDNADNEDMDMEDGASEHSGGDAIDRLKDDLFAEEDEEPEQGTKVTIAACCVNVGIRSIPARKAYDCAEGADLGPGG